MNKKNQYKIKISVDGWPRKYNIICYKIHLDKTNIQFYIFNIL